MSETLTATAAAGPPLPPSAGALIRADVARRLALEGLSATAVNVLRVAVKPGVVCVVAYRIATVLHEKRLKIFARLLDDLQHLYSGIEIHAGSVIGPGFVLGDRPGGGIDGNVTIGANCTVLGGCTMTLNSDGVDASKGRIVIGDECVIGVGAKIIGALTLGRGTQVKPNAVVLTSSPGPGGVLAGIPALRRAVVPLDDVAHWNPLRPHLARP